MFVPDFSLGQTGGKGRWPYLQKALLVPAKVFRALWLASVLPYSLAPQRYALLNLSAVEEPSVSPGSYSPPGPLLSLGPHRITLSLDLVGLV